MRVLALSLLLAAAPSASQGAADRWSVEEVDNGCMASTSYYGGALPTRLALGETIDGRSMMVLQNTGWSTVQGRAYDVYLLIDDDLFAGTATGGTSGSLTFHLEPKVMTAISKGTRMVPALKVDENNEKLLEQLKLTGTASAIARVRKCVAEVKTAKGRAKAISPDPFK